MRDDGGGVPTREDDASLHLDSGFSKREGTRYRFNLFFWYTSTSTDARLHGLRYSIYLFYWYTSTNTDARQLGPQVLLSAKAFLRTLARC